MLYYEGLVVLGRSLSVFADDYYVRITVQSKTPVKSLLLSLLLFSPYFNLAKNLVIIITFSGGRGM